MKIFYTKHANEKFKQESYVFKLKINKRLIRSIIQKPQVEDRTRGEKITAIRSIDDKHSFVVIYKEIKRVILVITFYPARKGRYEAKILQRR